ncbi:MAG: hypothetical protein ACYT04_89150, partial [Nostoc sp.]
MTTSSVWGSTTAGTSDAATGSTVSKVGSGEKRLGSKEEEFSSFLEVGDTGVSTTGSTTCGAGARGAWVTFKPFLATGSVTGSGWLSTIFVMA